MSKIHVLDKAVAELIAAGEVVERPASIVKELIENSIDAGASFVTVEIEAGGVVLIRVTDNGCGIAREDIPTAFLRHATSKVRAAGDLESIGTLGFRGEALASVAAVSRVRLLSKTESEAEGSCCTVEGGEVLSVEPQGCPTGTVIEVRDVFYNTPARMKFLKKDASESNAVAQVVDKCALAHPEIAFKFVRDGQNRLQTSGGGDRLAVIQAVYGREFASAMIPVNPASTPEGIRVCGYVCRPAGAKPSRTYQNFFLNARYIRTRTAVAAVEEAFRTLIPGGKYPSCVLNIGIDPSLVDVNVHPAKLEVRFADEKPVFQAVYFSVKSALTKYAAANGTLGAAAQTDTPTPAAQPARSAATSSSAPPVQRMSAQEFQVVFGDNEPEDSGFSKPLTLRSSKLDIYVDHPSQRKSGADLTEIGGKFPNSAGNSGKIYTTVVGKELISAPSAPVQASFEEKKPYRIIGELFGTYIVLQTEDHLVLVDKHAAHERMLYGQIKESVVYGNRQVLLTPLPVALAREDYDALTGEPERLLQLGFLIEDFGGNTVLVREIPIELEQKDIAFILAEIAGKLRGGHRDLTPAVLERLYFSIACKSAVRAKDKNTAPELAAIVRRLAEDPQITHCPHGRPVQIRLSKRDIEKLFGRQG